MTKSYVAKGLASAIALAAALSGTAVATAEEASAYDAHQSSERVSPSALAERIFDLTNTYRTERGIEALRYDSFLGWNAQQWAEEMRDNGVVGHAADAEMENVAWFAEVPTAEDVLNVWLENPGAREILLDPELHKIGIGVAQAEDGSYVVQRFEE
ncbi:CAP domain-containing protein [Corynebacterium sp. zg-331]|uniref:CAP domain-containing protein n=1 Tax=unclassified Corynebacterium TaxID=2624378 RepID=UPI0016430BA5|nr:MULTISPECIES: CAP domain-containing protein [unclassified Corynebacterium]MBC3186852.1 CAP domain-containing protein [Corynebacterium sp. zg-331]